MVISKRSYAGSTYTTETVVLVVIFWLLDHVSSDNSLVAMVVIGLVCHKIRLSQELLLMMLEFSDHDGGFDAIGVSFPFSLSDWVSDM